tara:strand:- start:9971 stop:10171 length:201 start_codon:yes stop_codon:yes gene_type:complete
MSTKNVQKTAKEKLLKNLSNDAPEILESNPEYTKEAEKANGRWAMIGFVALIGAYVTSGQIIPGIY